MSKPAKLMLLELVAGLFGWGWIIAGGFALYYLVMAIGFEGSWVWFFIALAASGIAKWLARGFEDSKQRVAFEADQVAKGMSPEAAGKAWIQAYTGQDAPEDSGVTTKAASMTEENRREAEERSQIVSDFAEFIERNPSGGEFWDVKLLPHGKEIILDAICQEIVREKDEWRLDALKALALSLADFQEEVGDKPLPYLGVDTMSVDLTSMSLNEKKAFFKEVGENPNSERCKALTLLMKKDQERILARTAAAEQMRQEIQ